MSKPSDDSRWKVDIHPTVGYQIPPHSSPPSFSRSILIGHLSADTQTVLGMDRTDSPREMGAERAGASSSGRRVTRSSLESHPGLHQGLPDRWSLGWASRKFQLLPEIITGLP